MKFDTNYKMNKMTKIMLINIHDEKHRSLVRNLFCEAENAYTNNKRKMSVKHVVDTSEE